MNRTSIVAWTACALSATVFLWAWSESRREVQLGSENVRGPAFDMPDVAREEEPLVHELESGRFEVDMRAFAFDDYDPPEMRSDSTARLAAEAFPEPLPALNGKRVSVVGYPLVTSLAEGEIEHLILTRFAPGCCFGAVPIVDEWLDVELARGQDANDSLGLLVRVTGLLEVGERIDDSGTVESLYRLRGATLDP